MIAGHTFLNSFKHDIAHFVSSSIGVLTVTLLVFITGMTACVYLTDTLLLPTLFAALMFPPLLSAVTHLSWLRFRDGFSA